MELVEPLNLEVLRNTVSIPLTYRRQFSRCLPPEGFFFYYYYYYFWENKGLLLEGVTV